MRLKDQPCQALPSAELHLSSCPDTLTKASATFTSQQFAELSGTLKTDPSVTGHADNVSLAFFNTGHRHSVACRQPAQAATTQAGGERTGLSRLRSSADWVKGTNDITAGKVTSNATFTMSYE
jgi:type 1 fimbria pilin